MRLNHAQIDVKLISWCRIDNPGVDFHHLDPDFIKHSDAEIA